MTNERTDRKLKLAFVHDWFRANGGAEKVAGEIMDTYNTADITIYTLFDRFSDHDRRDILKSWPIRTSFLQRLPAIDKYYRFLLPVMPALMRRFNLTGYDLILSTSHAVAKGFRSDGALHICYCHTPMRYVWDMYDDYAAHHKFGGSGLYRKFILSIRKWDLESADNVHYFIANSEHVRQRIATHYNRASVVIYPPVRVSKFGLWDGPREDYYLCPGRFVPYKKIDMVMRAFRQMPNRKLLLIGDGYGTGEFRELMADAPNITWLGYRPDAEMIGYMQRAKACIFAAKEDFGIMCVESQACGTPVLALNYGGYQETVVDGKTGYLFEEQNEAGVMAAVAQFEATPLTDHAAIRRHAVRFSDDRFREELTEFVSRCRASFTGKKQSP